MEKCLFENRQTVQYTVYCSLSSLKDQIDVREHNKGNPDNVKRFNSDGFAKLIGFINTTPPF